MNVNNFNGNNLLQVPNGTFDIFNYKNLGSVRCYVGLDGQKWFCHLDVCNILGISDQNVAMRRLDPWKSFCGSTSGIISPRRAKIFCTPTLSKSAMVSATLSLVK